MRAVSSGARRRPPGDEGRNGRRQDAGRAADRNVGLTRIACRCVALLLLGVVGALGLGVGDRIALRVTEWLEIDGDDVIDPDGAVTIPVLGRMALAPMTSAQVEAALAARLAERSASDATVILMVLECRPICISGQARDPGAIACRPGMTALQAIALAGRQSRDVPGGDILRLEREAIARRGSRPNVRRGARPPPSPGRDCTRRRAGTRP